MKKIITLFALMLCLCATAQEVAGEYMFIHRNNNTVERILLSEVDSVTFVEVAPAPQYEAIDLGLPSGLKWASCNVGANAPEEYGSYYAWAETIEKDNYSWESYKWFNGWEYPIFSKYCLDSEYGVVDGKTVLDSYDDVATVKWGSDWRTPTTWELSELIDECSWEWTALNGVDGYKIIGPNGNSIFLPSTGFRYDSEIGSAAEDGGCYWSSSLCNDGMAYAMYFSNGVCHSGDDCLRCHGLAIRPVCGKMSSPVYCTISVSCEEGGVVEIEEREDLSATVVYGISVTVTAMTNDGYEFVGWFVGDSDIPVSTEDLYTFNVSGDVALIAKFKEVVTTPTYEAIDLGLSVKWATCNVGATKPEEYGGYYAWGETEEKESYDASDYLYYKNGSYTNIGDDISGTQYDVAHVKWGGSWRMPTLAEQKELFNNCSWTWTTLDGVTGYRVTGPNGNSIFFPAAGYRYGTDVRSRGSDGNYWSSSLSSDYSRCSTSLDFDNGGYVWYDVSRYYGQSVRPVTE